MDVLAVEGGDEGLVELGDDSVGHLVAAVLDVLQLLHQGRDVLEIVHYLHRRTRAQDEVADIPRTCRRTWFLGGQDGAFGSLNLVAKNPPISRPAGK